MSRQQVACVKGCRPFSCQSSACVKGCRPWEVLGCRRFLQGRKNPRPPGPRPVHALLCKPRDRPPALMRRGSHSHGATPFPALLPADVLMALSIVLFLSLPSSLSFCRQSGKDIGSFLDHSPEFTFEWERISLISSPLSLSTLISPTEWQRNRLLS